jgi:hypothetical protein
MQKKKKKKNKPVNKKHAIYIYGLTTSREPLIQILLLESLL